MSRVLNLQIGAKKKNGQFIRNFALTNCLRPIKTYRIRKCWRVLWSIWTLPDFPFSYSVHTEIRPIDCTQCDMEVVVVRCHGRTATLRCVFYLHILDLTQCYIYAFTSFKRHSISMEAKMKRIERDECRRRRCILNMRVTEHPFISFRHLKVDA